METLVKRSSLKNIPILFINCICHQSVIKKYTYRLHTLLYQYLTAMSKVNRITIKDASRQNKYKIQNLFVYTPHQIYESQNTFITYVIKCLNQKQNALIQSPTGTGKTMSLLCATLAWALENQQITNSAPPQIVYASRTHAQLKQVVAQINKLCYQVKIAILSSRDQACANQDLKLLRGQDKQLECRLRIAQKRGLNCKFYKSQQYYQKQAELGKLMDIEEIVLKSKLQEFCPFYYQRFSRALANIVLVPYNYLFDKRVWSNEEGYRLQGSILILDEAHNIQSVCQQYRQYTINLSTLARAIQQAEQLRLQKLNQNKNKLDPGQLDKIKMLKISLQDIQINASYIQLIYQHMQTLDIPNQTTGILFSAAQFSLLLDKATGPSQFGNLSRNIESLIKVFQNFRSDMLYSPFWALESWMKFIQKSQEIINQSKVSFNSSFTIQVTYQGADLRINIHCLDPSSGFKEVIQQHKPRSVILTSGTLSPLKIWPLELGVQFAQPVSCPHVLSPQQVNTVILGVGPSGNVLQTKFENRKNSSLYVDIGKVLYEIVKNTPNGVVALFPSYSFLQQTKNHLASQNILTKLYECKNIYFQRKESSDFTSTLQRYMKEAQTDKGALLCSLIRGRVSEGLDFSHKKCRAVVLVGVPYPCSKDVKIVAKMNYLDIISKKGQRTINGSQWYLAETVRAINQGIGRLIRTPDDFGTVYLIDSRFSKPDIEAQLSSWARMNVTKPKSFQEFVQKVHQINNVKQNLQLANIQSELGFVSNRGTIISPQIINVVPPKIRGSISRPSKQKTPKQIQQEHTKGLTLNELMETIKSEKQAKDILRKQEEINLEELMKKKELSQDNYERRIFQRKTVKPLEGPKQICPICQIESCMVKSNTCFHSMCQQCWDKWLIQDLRCPICRGRVRKNFLVPQVQSKQ